MTLSERQLEAIRAFFNACANDMRGSMQYAASQFCEAAMESEETPRPSGFVRCDEEKRPLGAILKDIADRHKKDSQTCALVDEALLRAHRDRTEETPAPRKEPRPVGFAVKLTTQDGETLAEGEIPFHDERARNLYESGAEVTIPIREASAPATTNVEEALGAALDESMKLAPTFAEASIRAHMRQALRLYRDERAASDEKAEAAARERYHLGYEQARRETEGVRKRGYDEVLEARRERDEARRIAEHALAVLLKGRGEGGSEGK